MTSCMPSLFKVCAGERDGEYLSIPINVLVVAPSAS